MRTITLPNILLLALGVFIFGCQKAANTTATATKPATAATPSNAAPAPTPAPVSAALADNAPRITLANAKKAFDAGNAIFVDTRAESAYKHEHIKGSINIPAGSVDANIGKLSKDKKIIAYCS